jgi:hypothetical protein
MDTTAPTITSDPPWLARLRDHFAPPPAPLPAHIARRNESRREACTRLLEHLTQADGTLRLSGIHIGQTARAVKLKFKRVARALRDLVEIGIVAAYEAPAHVVQTAKGSATGNRCGHQPTQPRWFRPPDWHEPHPKILQKIIRSIRDYYERPAEVLPSLNAANRSKRRQKSERREACVALLAAVLHYTDLPTLRVGRPQPDGTFAGLTMAELAELAGLATLRRDGTVCLRRAERAMADLKAAGILTVKRQYEQPEKGVYKGLAAIRTVSKHLFTALGLDKWLAHERRRAEERREKRNRKRQTKALGNVRLAASAIDNHRPKPKEEAEPAPPARTGGMKSAADIAFETMRRNLGTTKPPA